MEFLGIGIWAMVGFVLASYAVVGNDALQTLEVVWQNLFRAVRALGSYELAVPHAWVDAALGGPWLATLALHVGFYAVSLALLLGFAASLRRGWQTLHVYALLYAALVLAWPFDPQRFLLPWTPFLLYFTIDGVGRGGGWLAARLGRVDAASGAERSAAWSRRFSLAFALALAAFFAREGLEIVNSTRERFYLPEIPSGIDLRESDALFAWMREHTDADDLVASGWAAGLYLNTGRRGHFPWPDSDPYARYYGADRSFRSFYGERSRSEALALLEELRTGLVATWSEAGIDWYVEQDGWFEAAVLAPVVASEPQLFEPRYQTPRGSMRVYRVRLPSPIASERRDVAP